MEIVERGYDKIAEEYLKKFRSGSGADKHSKRYLKKLVKLVPKDSKVLDLGCGAGIPITKFLTRFYKVTGADISAKQIELAKKNVPRATFIKADMVEIDFPADSFDAIVSFYAIFHIPRECHKELLRKIFTMLNPGGYFLGTMGARELKEGTEENWLGAPMYWSHFGKEKNIEILKDIGFNILISNVEVEKEDNKEVEHLYVLAQKPKSLSTQKF